MLYDRQFALSHYFILPMYAIVSVVSRERKQKGNRRFTAVEIPHVKDLRNICFISGEDFPCSHSCSELVCRVIPGVTSMSHVLLVSSLSEHEHGTHSVPE